MICLLLLAAVPVGEGPEKIRFETDVGPAAFDHWAHQAARGIDCSVCHHQDSGRDVKRPCGRCHRGRGEAGQPGGAPAYFDVKMKLCRGCHLERRESDEASKAPIHCAECHDIREKARGQGAGMRGQDRPAGPVHNGGISPSRL